MTPQLVASVRGLIDNLEEQTRMYRHLTMLSQTQLAAVRSQDVHVVHATLQEIEVAMLERSKLEAVRAALLKQAAVAMLVPVERVTASLLRERVGMEIGDRLDVCAGELKRVVAELDVVVAHNRALLEQELTIVDQIVKGMTVDRTTTPTYCKDGAQGQTVRLKLLDAQV